MAMSKATVLIVFRSKLIEGIGDDYPKALSAMLALAHDAPGFVDVKSFRADDGERLTMVRWTDEQTLSQWRNDPRHRAIQHSGRERWYESYDMEVATITRTSHFRRDS